MVTEQGKWLDGEAIFFEQTSETQQLEDSTHNSLVPEFVGSQN
jgi:hypothetical protein